MKNPKPSIVCNHLIVSLTLNQCLVLCSCTIRWSCTILCSCTIHCSCTILCSCGPFFCGMVVMALFLLRLLCHSFAKAEAATWHTHDHNHPYTSENANHDLLSGKLVVRSSFSLHLLHHSFYVSL